MYLLDTHAILFFLQGDERLSKNAKDAMQNQKCFFSAASLWEIAIKQTTKKLKFQKRIQDIWKMLELNGFENLPIFAKVIEQIKNLPFIHNDPFDRILISQAQTEGLVLITRDAVIAKYDVKTLW